MKRIISVICILSLLLACVPMNIFAYDELFDLVVNESFDNIATNGAPENIIVRTGLDARVVSRDTSNKALYAKADGCAVKISVPIEKTFSKTVFSFDIMIKGDAVKGEALSLSSSSTTNMLAFSPDRSVSLEDGMDVGGYSNGMWVSYAAIVDFDNQCYELYINGKSKLEKRYFYSAPAKPTSMNFNFSCVNDNDVSEIYLDNIRVYEGSYLRKNSEIPVKGFNNEVLDYDETQKETVVYDTVFVDSNSKQGIGSFSFAPKANTVAEWAPMEKDGTPYIHFVKSGNNDVYGDLTPTLYDGLTKYVYQADIYVVANQSNIIFGRANNPDAAVSYSNLLYVANNGSLKVDTITVGKIEFGKWVNIAVAVDLLKETQNVYVDRTLVAEDIPVHNGSVIPKYIRIGFTSGSSVNSEFYMNKIKLYDGMELRVFDDSLSGDVANEDYMMLESMKHTDNETSSQAHELLGTDIVFMTRNGKFYAHGKKLNYSDYGKNAYLDNGKIMVDIKVMEYTLNKELPVEDGKITINKQEIACVYKDGTYYLDASEAGKALNKFVYDESKDREFLILSDTDKAYSNMMFSQENQEPVDLLWRYMQFDRPSPEDILSDLKSGGVYKTHPRLLIKKDEVESLKRRIDSTPRLKAILNNIISTSNGYFTKDPIQRQYQADGFRIYASCAGVKYRLFDLCTVYLLTGDKKYAERAWLEIENACNWEDWNLSTHFLDSGEIGPGIAYAYDVLYDYLTDEQKSFIRQKLKEKYLDFCVGVYTGNSNYKAMQYKNVTCNWGAVCGASMMMVAFTFIDEEPEDSVLTQQCKYIISNALQTFEHIITAAAPEGHWFEGIGYYEFVQQHLGWCLEVLDNITGKTYNFLTAKGVEEITDYIMYMSTRNGGYNKSSTTGLVSVFSPESFIYAKLSDRPDKMGLYADYRTSIGVTSWLPQYLLFYDPDFANHNYENNLPLDRYYSSNGVGVIRSSWTDTDGLYVGMSGGYTSTYGDKHYDKGSFIFESQGVRWSIDMGRNGNNTMPYLIRAETHSSLVINPTADNYGQAFEVNSEMIRSESKPRGSYMIYDLSDIYGEWVNDYKRGFLVADERNTLTIRDELDLKETSDLKWNMITKADIDISDDGKSVILSQNGKKLMVSAISNAPDWHFEEADLTPTGGWVDVSFATGDEQKKFAEGTKKLVISAKASGKINITVKLTPMISGEEYSSVTDTSLSDWTIEDGDIPPKPEAGAIYADGKLINNFVPSVKTYNMDCAYGSPIPYISAEAKYGDVEIKQASNFADGAKVIVTAPDGKQAIYNIYFNVSERISDGYINTAPVVGLPSNMKILDITNVRSDHEPQAANPAVNVADGLLSTRWASDQKGTYVEVDLGQVYDLSGIALGFADGDKRNYKYDILVSEDKMDYKRIYSGYSVGGTLGYEFLPASVKARYVRYVGFQHKTGPWNSITEVRPVIEE